MATNHVRFALAPRRFHLVAGHGSRGVHIGERVLRFFHERMSGGSRPTSSSSPTFCGSRNQISGIDSSARRARCCRWKAFSGTDSSRLHGTHRTFQYATKLLSELLGGKPWEGGPKPTVVTESLIVPRSMCSHSALTDQFLANIHSAPRPATHPALVVLVVEDPKSNAKEEPQPPAPRQSRVTVVLTRLCVPKTQTRT